MEPDKVAAFKELISFLDDEESAKGTMRTAARETQDSGTIVTPQPGVHVATNFAFANTGFIAGEKGCVYIDCTEKMEKAKKVKEAYFKQDIKNKTIQGLVITHFHADHCMGTREMYSEFVKPEDTCETWNGPDIWSSEEFPQEFYSKACFMLGRWHKRGNNLNWSNYYVAKGLELKVGIVPKYTSGIRDAQAQRIPLRNLVSLLSVHLNPNVANSVSTEIKLHNSKLVKLNLHHGILDFDIKNGGVALDCGEISESKLRKMLCTLDLDGYKNVNLQKIFEFVDWTKTYKFD